MSAEPTAEQWAAAREALGIVATPAGDCGCQWVDQFGHDQTCRVDLTESVARALAAAVTAEREKVRELAFIITQHVEAAGIARGYGEQVDWADLLLSVDVQARRIREVTT